MGTAKKDHQVYAIGAPDWPFIKIGASNSPTRRLTDLRVSSPVDLFLLAVTKRMVRADAYGVEGDVHRALAEFRQNGEWFKIPIETALKALANYDVRAVPIPDAMTPKERRRRQTEAGRRRLCNLPKEMRGGRPRAQIDREAFEDAYKNPDILTSDICKRFQISRATMHRRAGEYGLR